jgi:hypothetical protein
MEEQKFSTEHRHQGKIGGNRKKWWKLVKNVHTSESGDGTGPRSKLPLSLLLLVSPPLNSSE